MTKVSSRTDLSGLNAGDHVCWRVEDDSAYIDQAAKLLMESAVKGLKPIAFGPGGSDTLSALAPFASVACDPHAAFLEGGPLHPEAMFAAFRKETTQAHMEGSDGLCVVADMDWLAKLSPSTESVVAFELLVGPVVETLSAIVVCAYRTTSFRTDDIAGMLAVHEIGVGGSGRPQFTFLASGEDMWRVSGEVDLAVAATFETAIKTAAGAGDCVLDFSGLEFTDVRSMRSLAEAGAASRRSIRVHGASSGIQKIWDLGKFAEIAPTIRFE